MIINIRQAAKSEWKKIAEIYQKEGDLDSVTEIERSPEYFKQLGNERII